MTNNDILRRVRYVFDLKDSDIMKIFVLAESTASREQVCDWLKKDDDPAFIECSDHELATFLNGFITHKRGPKPGPAPVAETSLTNNVILTKLKIALTLRSDDILELLDLAGLPLSKHELSAFFRKTDHKHYMECKDQVLRNFLQGLQLKHCGTNKPTPTNVWKSKRSTSD